MERDLENRVLRELHDAILVRLEMEWATGEVLLKIRATIPEAKEVTIVGLGLKSLECPRRWPWGESISINEVRSPVGDQEREQRIEIEMQSGDVLVVEATRFEVRLGW